MSEYDRQRDIEAEGQRASTRQPSAGGCPDCGGAHKDGVCTLTGNNFGSTGAPASPGGMTATEVAQRAAEEDAAVEAMARAMWLATNADPDEVGSSYNSPDDDARIQSARYARGWRRGKAWEHFAPAARMQLNAHRAMCEAMSLGTYSHVGESD